MLKEGHWIQIITSPPSNIGWVGFWVAVVVAANTYSGYGLRYSTIERIVGPADKLTPIALTVPHHDCITTTVSRLLTIKWCKREGSGEAIRWLVVFPTFIRYLDLHTPQHVGPSCDRSPNFSIIRHDWKRGRCPT